MEYKVLVYEVGDKDEHGNEGLKEVYKQVVEDLNIPALVELVNNGRRRTRSKGKDGATGTAA